MHINSVHEGKNSIKCENCDLNFTNDDDLKRHLKSIHEGKKSNQLFSFQYVSAGCVTRIIKRLKNTKAMGVDKIQTQVWKKGVTVLAGPIAQICNLSLTSGIFPNIFKEAIINPIFKGSGKDPH